MKKYILSVAFLFAVLITPIAQVQAAGLTPVQISAIIGLLQAFGADQSVIANVQTALSGGSTTPSSTSPTASLTINGQPSVTNANPLVQRTWGWSSTKGATYSASGNITGCDTASQNGPQQNWTPWTDTKATGNATNGSSSIIPGTVKYGCVIVGTYKVTNAAGETAIGSATITYRHANGSTNTTVVDTGSNNSGGLTITTGSTLHPIQSDHYWNFNLAYTGGTGTPAWSLVSGSLPATMELDPVKGTINNNNFFNHSPISVNNYIPEGTYTFTVKVTVGSQSATKQLSLEVRPLSDMRPIIMFGQQLNNAVNEYINGGDAGIPGTYHFYYFPNTENDVCTIVSGQLPPGVIMKTSVNGCMLSGAPTITGTFNITWKIENQYGSDTAEYPITIFTPGASITTSASSLPNATVGQPYSYQFPITLEGNLTATEISNIRFGLHNGLLPPGLSIDGLTGLISGTPTVAGLYNPNIDFGISTFQYLSHQVTLTLLVKPRTQSLSGLNADIVSAMNSLDWSAAHSAQSAISFKNIMAQKGWTLGDVATATGYKESDVVNTLYPDAVEKYDTIRFLIQGYVQTFDWSDANKQQSAIRFKALMDQKGWTLDSVKTAFPFTLGGQDPILTEILKAYGSGTANSSPVISSLSPSSGTVGTTVTINGSGFTGTNSIYLNGSPVDTLYSSGGSTPTWISFVIPSNLPSCPGYDRLCVPGPVLTSGTYTVRVQNTNGTSNVVSLGVN